MKHLQEIVIRKVSVSEFIENLEEICDFDITCIV